MKSVILGLSAALMLAGVASAANTTMGGGMMLTMGDGTTVTAPVTHTTMGGGVTVTAEPGRAFTSSNMADLPAVIIPTAFIPELGQETSVCDGGGALNMSELRTGPINTILRCNLPGTGNTTKVNS